MKDTVHKQTLIYHVANIVLDQFPDATDLYWEIGSVTRCAKVDINSMYHTVPCLFNRTEQNARNTIIFVTLCVQMSGESWKYQGIVWKLNIITFVH